MDGVSTTCIDLGALCLEDDVQVVLVLAAEQHVLQSAVVPTLREEELSELPQVSRPTRVPLELRLEVQQAALAALEPSRVAEVVEAADELVLVLHHLLEVAVMV